MHKSGVNREKIRGCREAPGRETHREARAPLRL